jgi:hypothetical protein
MIWDTKAECWLHWPCARTCWPQCRSAVWYRRPDKCHRYGDVRPDLLVGMQVRSVL